MKKLLLSLLFCYFTLSCLHLHAQSSTQAQLATDVELRGVGANGHTRDDAQQVTFIFRASYTGNIGGVAFTSTDVPLTILAQHGNSLRQIPYTVTAGTLVVISTHP